jgi:hypothetical protein
MQIFVRPLFSLSNFHPHARNLERFKIHKTKLHEIEQFRIDMDGGGGVV